MLEPEVANSHVPSPTSNEVSREPINMVNEHMQTATIPDNSPMTPTPDALPIRPSARHSFNTLGMNEARIPGAPLDAGQVEERPSNPVCSFC